MNAQKVHHVVFHLNLVLLGELPLCFINRYMFYISCANVPPVIDVGLSNDQVKGGSDGVLVIVLRLGPTWTIPRLGSVFRVDHGSMCGCFSLLIAIVSQM